MDCEAENVITAALICAVGNKLKHGEHAKEHLHFFFSFLQVSYLIIGSGLNDEERQW